MAPGRLALRPRARQLTIAAIVIAATAGVTAPASMAAPALACPGADAALDTLPRDRAEHATVCLSNAARRAVDLPALKVHARLQVAAARHAEDMQQRRFFDHVAPAPAPNGTTLLARVTDAGYPLRTAAENLASGQPTPRRVVSAWLTSPGHCRNLLDPAFTEVGVGRASQRALWVQVLGTRQAPPSTGPYAGCDIGSPPTLTNVVDAPDSTPSGSATPRSSGLRIARVARTHSAWRIRLSGGRAVGRAVTIRTYGARQRCVSVARGRKRCSTVPGARRASTRTTLRRATTTVPIARQGADAFVEVRHAAFRRDGTLFKAVRLTKRLPR